jgi:hypothetical protein
MPAQRDPGRCEVCGAALTGMRADAEVCGTACRRERSRLRALSAGDSDSGYATLAEYTSRACRRAKRVQGA